MIFVDAAMEANSDAALQELLPALRATAAATQKEKGCLIYRFSIDIDNPRVVRITELWESEADLFAHFQGEAMKPAMAAMPALSRILFLTARKGDLAPFDLPLPG